MRLEPLLGRRRNVRWSAPIEWWGLPLALLVDIVGVLHFAATGRLPVMVIAGALTTLVGVFWLWRLRNDTERSPTRSRLFLLNMFMVALGSGLLAAIWVYTWRDTGHPATPPLLAPQVPPSGTASKTVSVPSSPVPAGSPRPAAGTPPVAAGSQRPPAQDTTAQGTTGQPPPAGSRPAPVTSQRATGTPPPQGSTPTSGKTPPAVDFTGTIQIQIPELGKTLASGQSVYGSVTGWSAGFQVWLFVRPQTSILETPVGPCQVAGTTWKCANVQLPGLPGTREHLNVVVVPDSIAAGLSQLTTLPTALAQDATQVYKA